MGLWSLRKTPSCRILGRLRIPKSALAVGVRSREPLDIKLIIASGQRTNVTRFLCFGPEMQQKKENKEFDMRYSQL